MARFLIVVPPLTGHVNPTVSVATELERRGHEVAWVGHPGKVRPLLPRDARLFELDDRVPEGLVAEIAARSRAVRGLAALKFLWEDFLVPLARSMVPGVDAAIDAFRPDVLLVDQQALAGAVCARRRGLLWATSATTSASVTDPLRALPEVRRWVAERMAEIEIEAGLEPMPSPDLSPSLVLVFSTRALVGAAAPVPPQARFVGPALEARVESGDFPFEAIGPSPSVLVTLGTVNLEVGEPFCRMALETMRQLSLSGVVVAPDRLAPLAPPGVVVRPFVPQLALLARVDAVVCHGGHNTVCEALAAGLPLVVAPIKDDQPVIADQVAASGAGLRIKFGRARPADLADALRRVLEDPSFSRAARAIRASFIEAGGAPRAADLLEGLRVVSEAA